MNNKMALIYPESYYSPDTLNFRSVMLADETGYILDDSGDQIVTVVNDTLMRAICNQLRMRQISYQIHKQQFSHPDIGSWYEWQINYRTLYLPMIQEDEYAHRNEPQPFEENSKFVTTKQ